MSPRPNIDQELSPKCSEDDFSQQILAEAPFLRRIVSRWHKVGADADDLVQDTILRALANQHLWRPGTDLRAWLFTIMRNRFLGQRAFSFRAAVAIDAYAQLSPKLVLGSQDTQLVLRDVGRAMDRLPRTQRIALTLVATEGHSQEDAARELEISVGALRCHLARARSRLRKAVHSTEYTSPVARKRPSKHSVRGLQLAE